MENRKRIIELLTAVRYTTNDIEKVADEICSLFNVVGQSELLSLSDFRVGFEYEELQKCKDSPVYFYNKYVKKEGQKELTEDEYKDFVKQVEYQRNNPLKLRSHYKDRPLTPDQCYEKLPDFLKNGG